MAVVLVLLVGQVYDLRRLPIHQIVHHLDTLHCLVAFQGQDEFLQGCLLEFGRHLLAIRKSNIDNILPLYQTGGAGPLLGVLSGKPFDYLPCLRTLPGLI
jgi:hypothetical protein